MSNPIITNTSFSASGLPTGLSINPNTGVVSGTPTVVGSNNVGVVCDTNWGRDSKNLSVNVITRPALDVNDSRFEYVSYLPFDDAPTIDIANKITWQNYGCELITVGNGAHNKRLSFGNGGYMIGTGQFSLLDMDASGYVYGIMNYMGYQNQQSYMNEGFDLKCDDIQRTDADETATAQGCFICLYNDDLSNYLAFVCGRVADAADWNWWEKDDIYPNQVYPIMHFTGPEVGTPGSSFSTDYKILRANYNAQTDADYGTTELFINPKGGYEMGYHNFYTRYQDGRFDPALSISSYSASMYHRDEEWSEYGFDSMVLSTGIYHKIAFTHIGINYNPLYPNVHFSGSIGAIYLRKMFIDRTIHGTTEYPFTTATGPKYTYSPNY